MDITCIRVKIFEERDREERLRAFVSVTFDHVFVVRDIKVLEGSMGQFVAMPSRKLTDKCPQCGGKNHLRADHCNQCGTELADDRAVKDANGRAKLYADVAHPINPRFREHLTERILTAYEKELDLSKLPGYVCTYDIYDNARSSVEARQEEFGAGIL